MSAPGSDRGHREIDHTADLATEVWAPSREELFAEATVALAALCYERDAVEPAEQRRIGVEGGSIEELLVHWLQEAYFQLERDGWLVAGAREIQIQSDDRRVDGTLVGEPYDAERHTLHTEIKAITYHELRIRRDEDGLWRTPIVVDV